MGEFNLDTDICQEALLELDNNEQNITTLDEKLSKLDGRLLEKAAKNYTYNCDFEKYWRHNSFQDFTWRGKWMNNHS